jgi:hypothetical protein
MVSRVYFAGMMAKALDSATKMMPANSRRRYFHNSGFSFLSGFRFFLPKLPYSFYCDAGGKHNRVKIIFLFLSAVLLIPGRIRMILQKSPAAAL